MDVVNDNLQDDIRKKAHTECQAPLTQTMAPRFRDDFSRLVFSTVLLNTEMKDARKSVGALLVA